MPSLTENPPESTYTITRDGNVLHVAFGVPSTNDQIVKDAFARLDIMTKAGELSGGGLLKINGPASLPVAMVLAHKLSYWCCVILCLLVVGVSRFLFSIICGPELAVYQRS